MRRMRLLAGLGNKMEYVLSLSLVVSCRKRKRRSNSGSSISRTPRATGGHVTPSAASERLQDGTLEVVTELSCRKKKTKTDDTPCVDTHTHKTSCELAEHSRHGCESKWRSETGVCDLDSLMKVGGPQVRTSERTDAPPQCDQSPKVSSTLGVNHTDLHQQTSPAGPHSETLVDMQETVCGKYVSSVPIPDQQAGMVLGQTDVPHHCSTGTGAHNEREDDCHEMMFESHEDHLLDELFGLPEANSSLRNDGMAEDLLCGLCPEDLSFTLNASVCQDFAREDGFTSPRYSLVKSPNMSETPSYMKQRSGIATPQCAAAMCGEDATIGGSAATVPVSELRSTAGGLKEDSVVPLGVGRDRASQVGGGAGERRGGIGDGGGQEGGAGSGRGGGIGGVEEVGKRRERTEGGGGGGGGRGGREGGGEGGGGRGGGEGEASTLHCYPAETFYGLPQKVQSCLEENRGIKKLYGRQVISVHVPLTSFAPSLLLFHNCTMGMGLPDSTLNGES